ncbi:MAG: TRAP transporter small permease subunit [Rectinemataceae bacterium]
MARKFYLLFDRVRTIMMVSVSAFTIVLCFIQIILRYFTFLSMRPFAWGDEVLRLSAIWVIFLGLSIGVREGAHFTVDLFLNKIKSEKARRAVDLSIDILVMAILTLLTYKGAVYTITNTMSSLQNIQISMAWFYASVPVGCLFGIIEYLYKIMTPAKR